MLYTVWYKLEGDWFWKKIKKVKGDALITADKGFPEATYIFTKENESLIRVPFKGTVVMFSKERFVLIKQKMDSEAGQQIPFVMN
jgi:hypothetical protein